MTMNILKGASIFVSLHSNCFIAFQIKYKGFLQNEKNNL